MALSTAEASSSGSLAASTGFRVAERGRSRRLPGPGAEMGVWCLPEMNSQGPAQSFRSKLRIFSKPNSLKGQDDHRQRVAGKIPEERSLTICRKLLQDRPNAAMTSDMTLPASPGAPHSPDLGAQGPVVTTLIRCPVP